MMLDPTSDQDRKITAYTISYNTGTRPDGGEIQSTWSFD